MANEVKFFQPGGFAGDVIVHSPLSVPMLVSNSGDRAYHKFIGQIRNPNTRESYARAVAQFFAWCETRGTVRLEDISYLAVASYIEQHPASPPTVLQHLAAIRQLFAWLTQQGVVDHNPAENVKGPKHRVKVGKTPALDAEEMRQLLDSFDTSHVIGLRDRALIALMTFTFARIGAVVAMNVEDYFPKASRRQVRLHKKGGNMWKCRYITRQMSISMRIWRLLRSRKVLAGRRERRCFGRSNVAERGYSATTAWIAGKPGP